MDNKITKNYDKLKSDLIEFLSSHDSKQYCDLIGRDRSYIKNTWKRGRVDKMFEVYEQLTMSQKGN